MPPPIPIHVRVQPVKTTGFDWVVSRAELAIAEAAADFALEIQLASSVSVALDLRHRLSTAIEILQRMETLALERADLLCGPHEP